jgi:hypothetical protein
MPRKVPTPVASLPDLESSKDEDYLASEEGPVQGVYRLLDASGTTVYVGQSSNIKLRLAQHRKEQTKLFEYALIIPQIDDLSQRLRAETVLIMTHMPKYNRGINIGLAAGQCWEIKWPGRRNKVAK